MKFNEEVSKPNQILFQLEIELGQSWYKVENINFDLEI